MNKFTTATGAVIIVASTILPGYVGVANAVPRTEIESVDHDYVPLKDMQFFGKDVKIAAVSTQSTTQNKLTNFKDVKAGYWAESVIRDAVAKGYVNGYTDGSFKPDQPVSRSEFIKMAVVAIGYSLEPARVGVPWYTNYVEAAVKGGLVTQNEFGVNGYPVAMKRSEMARVAVRGINQAANDDASYILLAAKAGLITGTGNGNLDLDGTTTRAQAVAIIERILKVRAGETLPVDQSAVDSAQDEISGKKDLWGQVIRTTNLPKNAASYPYILKNVPNEMYEMPFKSGDKFAKLVTPASIMAEYGYNKEVIDKAVYEAKSFYDLIFNVDYRTISASWANKVYNLLDAAGQNAAGRAEVKKSINDYVQWVKTNKLVTIGSVTPQPSMFYYYGTGYLRSTFEFKVVSADKGAFNWDGEHSLEWTIFWGQIWDMTSIDPKVGVTYKGYSDIPLIYNTKGYYHPFVYTDFTTNYKLIK
ncbi:S-layer homology domain-containing protein [Cohnella thermotolerans]|uniref:S-layer homology domain-containing protein n=1 Tax=Cohnella thermotolerans TaxID=329858 RepID=UPI00042629D1|nr:S-layer homology domain-containing protein [Cohnella thermotolerans]